MPCKLHKATACVQCARLALRGQVAIIERSRKPIKLADWNAGVYDRKPAGTRSSRRDKMTIGGGK